MDIKRLIDLAMKNKNPQLVFKNAKIVNVFSHEIISGDLAIDNGIIVGIGIYDGEENIDVEEKFITPGLIDAHLHIESVMVTPQEFAKAVVPRGTTTAIADPHEIANVCGLDGIDYMLSASDNLPLDIYFMLPSCVPATNFENSGAVLNAEDLYKYINNKRVLGLGEMMNYPGVIYKDDEVIKKLNIARDKNKVIDGHGPVIKNDELNAYVISGVNTEHECTTVDEMIDRIRLGMYVMIREGSAARNLETLVRGVNGFNYNRCLFCTDDRHPQDILNSGHIDNNVRMAIKNGIDPITAIQIASINASNCYGLKNVGAIAPGYKADLLIVDNLKDFNIEQVYKAGKLVAEDKNPLFKVTQVNNTKVVDTVNIKNIEKDDISIKLNDDIVNVIRVLPHSLVTEKVVRKVDIENNLFKYNEKLDILKLVVIERHKNTGNIGLGLVENITLKDGAIASTIAHDSHNIIAVGDNDIDILKVIEEVKRIGGGIAVSSKGNILDSLSLPIGGIISDKSVEYVNEKLNNMLDLAYNKLNVNKDIDPFMTLSFLALPVIPQIKLTDKGLFDVIKFDFIDI